MKIEAFYKIAFYLWELLTVQISSIWFFSISEASLIVFVMFFLFDHGAVTNTLGPLFGPGSDFDGQADEIDTQM